jgi:hypothetical protein
MRNLAIIFSIICSAIIAGFLSIESQAVEEPYAVISRKNLFHPERKEWIMESSDKKGDNATANVPKLDPQKVKLKGTIIVGNERKAVLSTTGAAIMSTPPGRMAQRGVVGNAQIYMEGDFIEGYLVKEVNEKNILLSRSDGQDEVTIFLHEGSKQHTSEGATQHSSAKTELEHEQKPPAIDRRREIIQRTEPKSVLMERLKRSRDTLRFGDNANARELAKRDYNKLDKLFPEMSEAEKQELILLKKEIDKLNAGREQASSK